MTANHHGLAAPAAPAAPAALIHPRVAAWIEEMARVCQPESVHWCDGSAAERQALTEQAVAQGIFIALNARVLPRCYYHRSHPDDVARTESCTYICSVSRDDAGPTNQWAEPAQMRRTLMSEAWGSMRGRTLYVVPYLMGVRGSPLARVGVELTDSLYVALSMGTMTRMGAEAWDVLGRTGPCSLGLHCMLDLAPAKRCIAHFPQSDEVISIASNYGGNALLGKKCFALRLASCMARREGWLAEHMLIAGIESPRGEITYVAAAMPSACGKTNLAMLAPPEHYRGWKVWTVGDDIAWMRIGDDGRLYAMNPENGYFGVVPGTNARTNPHAMACIRSDTIYTNVALTHDLDVWWEGKDGLPPEQCFDWQGRLWTPRSGHTAAHPNSRFTCPMANNPVLSPSAGDPLGVPISAIIFGGRRASTYPLVFQAFNWIHGVYLGATLGSETTAAASGAVGEVRRDPMAMLPFCGYNMGDYFAHWLEVGHRLAAAPRLFQVNWFRRDAQGELLWPGFGDNLRVLRWIVDRCHGRASAHESAIGWVPDAGGIDLAGLGEDAAARLAEAQAIHPAEWRRELDSQRELFARLGDRMPRELVYEAELTRSRLG